MQSIKTYNNTKHELEIAKIRRELLLDKKEQLHSKYFRVTSSPETQFSKNNSKKDNYNNYIIELTKINPVTGMSIDEEIREQTKYIKKMENNLNEMTKNLLEFTGIEYEIYYLVVVKGLTITKAVEKTAELYDKEYNTIWKIHYPKVKDYIGALQE